MKKNLIISTVILSLLLAACSSSIDFKSIVDDNPGTTVNVNKVTGQSAELLLSGLEEFCPEANGDELYRVQVIDNNSTLTKLLDKNGRMICEVDTSDPEYAQKSVAVSVNDDQIYLAEVQNAINSLPQEQRAQGAQQAVNNLVNEKLLLQQASEEGVTATEQEVNQALSQAINQSSLSLSQLTQNDVNALQSQLRERIITQKMVQKVLQGANVQVSESELRTFYDQNKENMTFPQTWTIRQIQINTGDRTAEQTRQKAQTVYDLLNSSEFCSLVTQFSDDTQSLENCGEYTFTTGQMIPSIEQEIMQMSPGEMSIVQSQNAFHIIEFVSKSEARQASFEEARDQLENQLVLQQRQQALNSYLQNLRNESEIVSYLG